MFLRAFCVTINHTSSLRRRKLIESKTITHSVLEAKRWHYPADARNAPLTTMPPLQTSIFSLFLQRDSWDPAAADSVSPGEGLCTDSLASVPPSASATGPDSGSPSPYRGANRGSGLSSTQNYFHPLDEVHYSTPYASTSGYACPPYMTVPTDLPSKMPTLSGEESDSAPPTISDAAPWQKDDGTSAWSPYEIRRTY